MLTCHANLIDKRIPARIAATAALPAGLIIGIVIRAGFTDFQNNLHFCVLPCLRSCGVMLDDRSSIVSRLFNQRWFRICRLNLAVG